MMRWLPVQVLGKGGGVADNAESGSSSGSFTSPDFEFMFVTDVCFNKYAWELTRNARRQMRSGKSWYDHAS